LGFFVKKLQSMKQTKKSGQSKVNLADKAGILFTCIGRRVSLLNCFRRAAGFIRMKTRFIGTDVTELSPAFQLCDNGFLVKPTTHPGYIQQLLTIVKNNNVKLLVPTVDWDLKVLSLNKSKFAEIGCTVLVSQPQVIDICQDKRQTYKFFISGGFDTPVTMTPGSVLSKTAFQWPCFVKPWDGYAGIATAVAANRDELSFYAKKIPNAICQEFVKGREITCDVFVDFNMKVRCVVPRERIEVRAGEVSKSKILKDTQIMNLCTRLIETLGAGPGVVTVQLFRTSEKKIKFTEINPRFGGGAPLSIQAGADFPKWILQEIQGKEPEIQFDGFTDGLVMLRYDSEVWFEEKQKK
jgi:carbamoyl-phosphate synthase large subunit